MIGMIVAVVSFAAYAAPRGGVLFAVAVMGLPAIAIGVGVRRHARLRVRLKDQTREREAERERHATAAAREERARIAERGDRSRRGLVGMGERMERLGGEVQAGRLEGGGYDVRARLPLTREEVHAA